MKVESLADWDRAPAREILAGLLLHERAFVWGDKGLARELDAMAAAGLVEHRLAEPSDLVTRPPVVGTGQAFVVSITKLGRVAALRLAYSIELVRGLITCARMLLTDYEWEGASPEDMLTELDLRDGGTGEVDDPGAWLEARGTTHVEQLHRRGGLDGDAGQQEASRHAS